MSKSSINKNVIILDGKELGLIKIEINWEKRKVWVFSEKNHVLKSIEN